ncbi:hypothetical protein D3C72_2079900 [compost metagenome]
MMLAQGGGTEGEFECDLVAKAQDAMHMLGYSAARNAANVEFETIGAGAASHGVAARRKAVEADLGILSRGKIRWRAVVGGDPNPFDVVSEVFKPAHDAGHES